MTRRFVCFLLLATGVLSATRAHASADRVSFLNDIHVAQAEEADDVVCFLCSIYIEGPVHGDVVSFAGGVKANAPVHGDVATFLGGVDLGDDANLNGDLVVFGGRVHRADNARIRKEAVVFPLLLLVLPLVVVMLLVYGVVAGVRGLRSRAYYPAR